MKLQRSKRATRPPDATRLRLRGRFGRVRVSAPRDWSDLGRWVLAEALHRALLDVTRAPQPAPRIIPFPRRVSREAADGGRA